MALTPQVRASQGKVLATSNFNDREIQVTQALVLTAINFPSEEVEASRAWVNVVAKSIVDVQVSAARVYAAALGRIGHPRVVAWTYTLDGHDYYVLRLGDAKTLVFDLTTEQVSTWTSDDLPFWRLTTGMNWIGGINHAYLNGSNVFCLDDTYATVWTLDPDKGDDDDPTEDEALLPTRFERRAMAQVPARGRTTIPCWDVFLMGDFGNPLASGDTIQLEYSDDAGNTFVDAGTVTVTEGEYTQDVTWTSLGQIRAPGRLFRITDYGAVSRIDDLQINTISEN